MKKIIFIGMAVLLASISQIRAQVNTAVQSDHKADADLLFKKAKKQKTTAWILLGGGVVIASIGIISEASDVLSIFDEKKSSTNGVLLATGTIAALGSIPFFIASGKNKTKANLALKSETLFFNSQSNLKSNLTSIVLKINL